MYVYKCVGVSMAWFTSHGEPEVITGDRWAIVSLKVQLQPPSENQPEQQQVNNQQSKNCAVQELLFEALGSQPSSVESYHLGALGVHSAGICTKT